MRFLHFAKLGMAAWAMTTTPWVNAHQQLALADLSFEELGDITITSVSRQPERLADAPASVFVITADDIRRSGYQRLPEVLRLAPNLQVARSHQGGHSISARGSNNTSGNKLLVLVDGRSVYTPLFSGVFWDVQDVMLEDVERIEVISGPGGAVWGVNAVNGVINVITRAAAQTAGGMVSASASPAGSDLAIRHGGRLGQGAAQGLNYRLYAKYSDQQGTQTEDDRRIQDEGWFKRAGFRVDSAARDGLPWTVAGEVYEGRRGQPEPGTLTLSGVLNPLHDVSLSGGHVRLSTSHRLQDWGSLQVQAYYDRTVRKIPGLFDDTLNVLDLQFQHAWETAAGHAVVWGGEFRQGRNHVKGGEFASFLPGRVTQRVSALFAQDTITLTNELQLTLGARIERNDYTGNEFLPSARLAWKPAPEQLWWAAVSRTVRAPSRLDRDLQLVSPDVWLTGGSQFSSEVAKVYELGYRGQPSPRLSWSITAYRTDYDHLRTYELDPASSAPFVVYLANQLSGHTTGLETWATFQASPSWRLSAGATVQDKDLRLKPGSAGLNGGAAAEGNDPSATLQIRSTFNVTDHWELDAMIRHVARLPDPEVPAYTALDVGVGWRPTNKLEVALGVRNLLDHEHAEFGPPDTRAEFGAQAFARLVASF